MKKVLFLFFVISMLFFIGACSDRSDDQNQETKTETPTISEEERIDPDTVVVTVNGEEVKGVVYNLVYAQLKLHALQTGQDVKDEEIVEKTIESLIDRQILLQEARSKGIEITEEQAKEQLERVKEQNKEAYETLLEQYQITEEEFVQDLIFEMTLNEYLYEHVQVTVTDEEVEKIYEEEKQKNENMPELAEIRDTLKKNIENRRMMEALQARVDEIKEKVEIERHL